ncbi:MAG: YfhO family protein [Pseudobdellovibrionaceae bacterium]
MLRPRLRLFLQCAFIIVLIFPDVIFKGASISMLDQANFTSTPRSIHTLFKERDGLEPSQSFYDFGGSAFQSEPAIQFLKHSIYKLQSPYWNPYSGAGAFGPETMVDIKFSPLSLAVALLGGSNFFFHFITLLFYTLALYFLALTLREHLGFSLKTSLVTCVVFLLNGYFTANISSNTNQAYLYFPLTLYSILTFCKRPSVNSYIMLVGSYVLPFCVTFFPTTVLMVTCAFVITVGASLKYFSIWKFRHKMVLLQASAAACAILLLAFIYLPTSEALNFVGAFDLYSRRTFNPANYQAIISFFTPKHVFESYNAINPAFSAFEQNTIFHFGIISGCIVAIIVFSRRWWKDALLSSFVLLFILSFGRVFDLPLITTLLDQIPFFRNIAEQYWWMMVACSFPLIFAYGLDQVEMATFQLWPAVLVALVIILDLIYILKTYGILRPERFSWYVSYMDALNYVIKTVFITITGLCALVMIRRRPDRKVFLVGILCFSVCLEMHYYFNTARFERMDVFQNPPEYILFLKKNLGLNRLAAFGSTGFPPEIGTAYQLQQIEFFTMNIFPSYYSFCQKNLTTEHGWWGKDTFCVNRDTRNEPNVNLASLDLLSVRYLVVSSSMEKFASLFEKQNFPLVFKSATASIFENPHAFPRVYAVRNLFKSPNTPDSRGLSAKSVAFTEDNNLLKEANLLNISTQLPLTNDPSSLFDSSRIISYENTKVIIEANFTEPGILVVPDNWHPNWTAMVDHQTTYIGKVNESFRGLALGAGKHDIEMSYQPATLPFALVITSFMSCLLMILFFARKKVDVIFKHSLSETPQSFSKNST